MTNFATISLIASPELDPNETTFQLFVTNTHIRILGSDYILFDDNLLEISSLAFAEICIAEASSTTELTFRVWKPKPFDTAVRVLTPSETL